MLGAMLVALLIFCLGIAVGGGFVQLLHYSLDYEPAEAETFTEDEL